MSLHRGAASGIGLTLWPPISVGRNKCHATRNKCLTTRNKKLVETIGLFLFRLEAIATRVQFIARLEASCAFLVSFVVRARESCLELLQLLVPLSSQEWNGRAVAAFDVLIRSSMRAVLGGRLKKCKGKWAGKTKFWAPINVAGHRVKPLESVRSRQIRRRLCWNKSSPTATC